VDDHGERRGRLLADAHPRDRNSDSAGKRRRVLVGRQEDRQEVAEQRGLALRAGSGRTRSCARPSDVSLRVSWPVISSTEPADRDVIWVRPAAMAKRFFTLWLISPASSSLPSSACFLPVTSRKIPNITASPAPASAARPRAEIHLMSSPAMIRKSIS
jgi:hypothetical protein